MLSAAEMINEGRAADVTARSLPGSRPVLVRNTRLFAKAINALLERAASLLEWCLDSLDDIQLEESGSEKKRMSQFDYCQAVRQVCNDICERVPAFRHIQMDQVAVSFAQARRNVDHGMQAQLTPLRFEGGAMTSVIDGREYQAQRLFRGETEMLYVLTFYLPRFQQQSFREKLVTIFHELFHISPAFDGDLRRFEGRCYMHSGSQKNYDAHMETLSKAYLADRGNHELLAFLRCRFETLERKFGNVVGIQIPIPKLIPILSRAGG